ncbi:MAG: DUF5020 family protein [Bacteroidaceae bacterium]|nr:DUF5020 family protein [Bacteroidaceae bacterium]MDO4956045.1 DUF5020 family protein [Bacteroidales bacterium]
MKKLFLTLAMGAFSLMGMAQNVQLHYDLGRTIYSTEEAERPRVTVTFEQFKADGLGSWFYFVDMDINNKGVASAYTEISREFNLGNKGVAAHIEYDGGLSKSGSFQSAALIGPAWNGHNADFSTTYSVQVMYKHFFNGGGHRAYSSAQLTGVWSTTFANKALTFSGFVDLWRGEKFNNHGQLVFLTEPQLWYNVNDHISFGTEWEISNNFIFNMANDKKFFFNPTIAAKFNF